MLEVVPTLSNIDAVVTDAPYHLTSIVKRFGGENAAPAQHGTDGVYARASSGFMGKQWDGGDIAFRPETWRLVFDAMKPGAYLAALGGTRTYHRMACAIEDAGFEIRDTLCWLYGTGFPKSHDVSKGIDKAAGVDSVVGHRKVAVDKWTDEGRRRTEAGKTEPYDVPIHAPATPDAIRWQGWGTALKPAFEPIILARKPLSEKTVVANVLAHGTGALNIDATRVAHASEADRALATPRGRATSGSLVGKARFTGCADYAPDSLNPVDADRDVCTNCYMRAADHENRMEFMRPDTSKGRWPANVLHDGSEEVEAAFAAFGEKTSGSHKPHTQNVKGWKNSCDVNTFSNTGDSGTASRFFMTCKYTDKEWNAYINASDAGQTLNLQSERVVSALSSAVEQSMPQSALLRASYQAPSMSATASELSLISALSITMTQNIASAFSQGLPLTKLSLSLNHANCAAIQTQTGIMQITISHWRSSGSADLVTFSITLPNVELGAKASTYARFHYSAKASKADRAGSRHPTVKPIALMRWLCRLVTPPGGTILDPFAGSGSTLQAAVEEGFNAVGVEREAEYYADICRRIGVLSDGVTPKPKAAPAFNATGQLDLEEWLACQLT